MKKTFLIISLALLILLILFWDIPILKCEILTYKYGYQFDTIYQENTNFDKIEYLKVLEYSDTNTRVYYVTENRATGEILNFSKRNGEWKMNKWWTVWSNVGGSADDFVWPYIR